MLKRIFKLDGEVVSRKVIDNTVGVTLRSIEVRPTIASYETEEYTRKFMNSLKEPIKIEEEKESEKLLMFKEPEKERFPLYRNNKTGELYKVVRMKVINVTNAQDGTQMVLYEKDNNYFVRELIEFYRKFTQVALKTDV